MCRERVVVVINVGLFFWCDFFVLIKRIVVFWNEIGRLVGDVNFKLKCII